MPIPMIKQHWLEGARRIISPNCSERPLTSDISLLVIHSISLPPGEFGGPYIDQLFTNSLQAEEHAYFEQICRLRVSAHVLVGRNGTVTQYVPFDKRAHHAGISCYRGREACNDFSIGIELEGTDDSPFEDVQYTALIGLTRALLAHYPTLDRDRITGHSDIAPGRKTDPGSGFDWSRYLFALDESEAS